MIMAARSGSFRDVLTAILFEVEDQLVAEHERAAGEREEVLCARLEVLQRENMTLHDEVKVLRSHDMVVTKESPQRMPQSCERCLQGVSTLPGEFLSLSGVRHPFGGDGTEGRPKDVFAEDPFPVFPALVPAEKPVEVVTVSTDVPRCKPEAALVNGQRDGSPCDASLRDVNVAEFAGRDPMQQACWKAGETSGTCGEAEAASHAVESNRPRRSQRSSSIYSSHLHGIIGGALLSERAVNRTPSHCEADRVYANMEVLAVSAIGRGCGVPPKWSNDILEVTDIVMGGIILLNALQIGLSSDLRRDWPGWLYVDMCFATSFVIELSLKVWVLGCVKYFCGKSWAWSIFDAVMTVQAVIEVLLTILDVNAIKLSLFRIVRVFRLTRILRLLRLQFFRDLLMMIDGVIGGSRTLGWSIVLLMAPLYSVAVCLRETLGESEDPSHHSKAFSSLSGSMFTVFRCIMGDCSDEDGRPIFVHIAKGHGWYYALFYCTLITLTTFGLFNVIIAIYVENTVVAAKSNENLQRRRRLGDQRRLALLSMRLLECFKPPGAELTAEMRITAEHFDQAMANREVQELFDDLDVAEEDRLDLFDILDADASGEVKAGQLLQGVRKLRGDARRSDVIANGLVIKSLLEKFLTFQEAVEERQVQMAANVLQNGQISRKLQGKFDAFSESVRQRQVQMFEHVQQNGELSRALREKFDAFEEAVRERQLKMAEIVKMNGEKASDLKEKFDAFQAQVLAKLN